MNRLSPSAAGTVFFLAAPGLVAGLIPALITGWSVPTTNLYFTGLLIGLGGLVVAGGLIIIVDSFIRFVSDGRGRPMPWMPTELVVVQGAYRYIRNPIYVGVVAVIFGQALLFWSPALLFYGVVVWLVFHLFVILVEESGMRRSFGKAYDSYIQAVPRWFPRMPAAEPPADTSQG